MQHCIHIIYAPALEVAKILQFGTDCGDQPYLSVGTMMLVSTPTHHLPEYELYHSQAEYTMGPFSRQWNELGRFSKIFGKNISGTKMQIFGAIHSEAYAFNGREGGVDFYVRAALTVPAMRYHHYWLNIADNTNFWKAKGYDYMGTVDKANWAKKQYRATYRS